MHSHARKPGGRRWLVAALTAVGLTLPASYAASAQGPAPLAAAADTTAPSLEVDRPAAGAVLDAAAAAFSGTAGDDTGVSAVFVQVRDNTSNLWLRSDGTWGAGARRLSAILDTPGAASVAWSLTTTLADGHYGFDVVARDAAGNLSPRPWRTFRVSTAPVDTTAPTVGVTSPTAGQRVLGPAVTLTGPTADDTGVTAVYVQVRDNTSGQWLRPDGTWGTGARRIEAELGAPGSGDTSWRLVLTLPDGSFGFDVVARDAAGHWSPKPWTRFSVSTTQPDTTPPTVVVTRPTSGYAEGPPVRLAGTAADDRAVTAVYAQVRDTVSGLWLRADGSWGPGARRIPTDLDPPAAASTTWQLSAPLAEGRYGFDVIARDAAGNWSTKPWTAFTVVRPTPDVPSRIALTPTTTPSTSQAISWLAPDDVETGFVEIQPDAGGPVRSLPATAVGAVHSNSDEHLTATVDGLSPGTAYRYRVGRPGVWSGWSVFSTEDPAATDFSFLYFGDAQEGLASTWPRVVAAAQAKAPDAVGSLHAGDLVDEANEEVQWYDWFSGLGSLATSANILAAPGNHEYLGDAMLQAWKVTFEYPRNQPSPTTIGALADLAVGDTDEARQHAAYFEHFAEVGAETVYAVDYQGVRFVTLNATRNLAFLTPPDLPACTGAGCPSSSPGDLWIRFQAAWLDGVLADNPSTWSVVTFHQPVFSTSVGRDEPIVRRHWVPVFEDRRVDLVLMGHDHAYARGYDDRDATATPGLTSGPVYVVSNAGAKHYVLETDPTRNVWTANGATQVRTGEGVTTYQVVDVTADTLRYRSWLAERTPTSSTDLPVGSLFDEFTITRAADGRRWVTEPGVPVP